MRRPAAARTSELVEGRLRSPSTATPIWRAIWRRSSSVRPINNFGVRELLECFIDIAPSPRPSQTETRRVEPAEEKMTGFVFKIHANMDPNHRDRIAFLKICSGRFERNRNYLHVRSGKQLKFFVADGLHGREEVGDRRGLSGRYRGSARHGQPSRSAIRSPKARSSNSRAFPRSLPSSSVISKTPIR